MSAPILSFALEQEYPAPVAGVDEVGRGPLAGPVVAAAVILNPDDLPAGLADSKKLSKARREAIAPEIWAKATVALGQASVAEIDEINILQATFLAMQRALADLPVRPAFALVDGNRLPNLEIPAKSVIKGDATCLSIAAASIVAKVHRDQMMAELHEAYPAYGWAQNAGYGVAAHLKALELVGASPHHRKSFAPVHKVISEESDINS